MPKPIYSIIKALLVKENPAGGRGLENRKEKDCGPSLFSQRERAGADHLADPQIPLQGEAQGG